MNFFDDEYEGPRWRYGMTFRPLMIGAQPRDFIIQSDRKHPNFRHGTVDYPRLLTDKEIYDFELTLVETVEGKAAAQ